MVNHRIAVESTVSETKQSIEALIRPVATKYGLDFIGFDQETPSSFNASTSIGRIAVSDAYGTALEPAPVTPTDSAAWRLLSGTIRGTWREFNKDKDEIIVAPRMIGGNTGQYLH